MYHYVRPEPKLPPKYYHLDLDDFRRQLDYLESRYDFVDQNSFIEIMQGQKEVPEDKVVLNFDDGLLDHYEYVFPELVKRDLWGIFYIPTLPITKDKILPVHKIHSLLGKHGGDKVLRNLKDMINEEMIPHKKRSSFKNETYLKQNNSNSTDKVKRILNYYIANQYVETILNQLQEEMCKRKAKNSEIYVSKDNIKEMKEQGMMIGSHTVTHKVLSKLDANRQKKEIENSIKQLDPIEKNRIRSFCHPYGGSHSYNKKTIEILRNSRCKFAFSVDSRDIKSTDIEENKYSLPRYDCNQIKHGNASGSLGQEI